MLTITSLFTALRTVALNAKGTILMLMMVVLVAGCVTEPPKSEQKPPSVASVNKEGDIREQDTEQPVKSDAETKTPPAKETGKTEEATKLETTIEPLPQDSASVETVEPAETVAIVAPAIPPVSEVAKDPVAALPISPNHFIITAEQKNSTHPYYEKGHKLGFAVNGKQGQDIVVLRGQSYQLEVKTDPKHDVYLSSKAIGWGSSAWTKGVEGAFIYQGIISFKPDLEAPDVLYYSCRNHPYMGGRIVVLNEGQSVDSVISAESAASLGTNPQVSAPIPVTQVNVTAAIVNQKLMFADMLAKSSSAKQVSKSGISDAIDKQNQAIALIASSHKQLNEGKNAQALQSATQAVDLLKQAKKLVPSQADMAQFKANYTDFQESIKNFEASHKKTSTQLKKKEGAKAVVEYDKKKVEGLKSSAAQAALKGNYPKAVAELTQAQRLITASIQKMLDSKTIVYDLKFESPQEEYEYELKRFGGYEELIPIAIEAKKPAEGAKKLMQTYLVKGQKLRDSAIKKAASGDYPTGIAMLLDATKEVRRALRMIGVSQ